jgi:hypothetical protein
LTGKGELGVNWVFWAEATVLTGLAGFASWLAMRSLGAGHPPSMDIDFEDCPDGVLLMLSARLPPQKGWTIYRVETLWPRQAMVRRAENGIATGPRCVSLPVDHRLGIAGPAGVFRVWVVFADPNDTSPARVRIRFLRDDGRRWDHDLSVPHGHAMFF